MTDLLRILLAIDIYFAGWSLLFDLPWRLMAGAILGCILWALALSWAEATKRREPYLLWQLVTTVVFFGVVTFPPAVILYQWVMR